MNKWIVFLLIFSLAVNIAVMGTLIYYWTRGSETEPLDVQYRPPVPPGPEKPQHVSEEERQKIRKLRREYFTSVRALRREIGIYHDELMDMLVAESFPRDSVRALLQKIGKKQMELEQLTIDHLLELKKTMDPEHWQVFVDRLKRERPLFNTKLNRCKAKHGKKVKY